MDRPEKKQRLSSVAVAGKGTEGMEAGSGSTRQAGCKQIERKALRES